MTLLVVSLEVPKTFDQLMVATEVHLYRIWSCLDMSCGCR
ncbi:hypothetical protein IH785_14400 [candidate division KSB1 bacterium]|nr:hypothetical protein [candidate division KSB1 bacterium]